MKNQLQALLKLSSVTLSVGLIASGCGKSASFSLLADSATFTQNSAAVNGKIDILFVIDNSGSMATSQQALADNIGRFFEKFDAKGFDYRIAVTTSDAWRVGFGGASTLAKLRDGTNATSHTGTFIVTPTTPNKQNVFITNVLQGTAGNGDERVFQSFRATLESSENTAFGFPRADAFFSIIMLSDADDLSNTTASTIDTAYGNTVDSAAWSAQYTNPNIIPVQSYVDYLDTKLGVNGNRSSKYNVNSIGVLDNSCIVASENKKAIRMGQLADLTGGIKGSLCDDFGTTLSNISYKIIELRTRFYLERALNADSLHVYVDGVEAARVTDSTPQPWNGYYYHADDNSISFHGTAVPGPGASIRVSYDPTSLL